MIRVLGILLIITQIGLAIHAYKRGYGWHWLSLIIFMPVFGIVLYFWLILKPELASNRVVRKASNAVTKTLYAKKRLRERLDALDVSDTVENRVQLANELMQHDMPHEAIEVYHKTQLTPLYKDDPAILIGLANAYFESKKYRKTIDTLDKLIQANPDYKSQEGHLLYARGLEMAGEENKAREEYDALIQYYTGVEAKCRYAMFLKRLDETDKARYLFEEITQDAQRNKKFIHDDNKRWIGVARQELALIETRQ